MSLEIQDMEGNKVTTLSPGKSKGINIVRWNYTSKAPKNAAGKTLSFGAFQPLRAKAGTYKAVMKKGKDTYETTFTIQNDPKSFITAKEREAQYKTATSLFDIQEDLAYMVYKMDAMITSGEKAIEANPKAKKVSQPLIDELNALKETLVITSGDNYVDSAPPQLREKLAGLYSDVAANFEAPSQAQLENYKLLSDRFNKAKADLEKITSKRLAKFTKYTEKACLLYTSPSPRDQRGSRMPSSA